MSQRTQPQNNKRTVWWLVLLSILIGCTPFIVRQLDELYGQPNPERYNHPTAPVAGAPEYWRDVRPVMEQRCAVCHGCYDAPCQQNLTSWDGIARGGNTDAVYTDRLKEADPTRLFIDAQLPSQWRKQDFHPVLNERDNTKEANLQGSVMYRLLDLKRKNPLPHQAVLDSNTFTFSLNREQTCPAIEKMDAFEKDHPEWGMPYGLPGLSNTEFNTIENWIAAGSPVATEAPLPTAIENQITAWEVFFNGSSNQQKLMSRYIYEHLFLAHLYFGDVKLSDTKNRYFFRLVRSSTPPGTPAKEIASRRPYDDPGTSDFWYRIRHDENIIVEKTHMPYALNSARQTKWAGWFLNNTYTVTELPSYAPDVAGNPFIAFKDLPVDSRYRFLLDESDFVIDNFIKGPVCRGQVALGVIDSHFWVFFIDPDKISPEETSDFLAKQSNHLRLPTEDGSDAGILSWIKYSKLQKEYLKAKAIELKRIVDASNIINVDLIWSGDKNNDNAAVTVFRHNDNATAVKGLVGQPPKTAWLMSYTLLERIHYLLVAGFDVYGDVAHQLNSRLYMDFLRMEGESNFLALLPEKSRLSIRDYWYRDAGDNVKDYLYGAYFNFTVNTDIVYKTDNPQQELYNLLAKHIGNNLSQNYNLNKINNIPLQQMMNQLQQVRGAGLSFFPSDTILRVDDVSGQHYYFTLLNNIGYSNNSELFDNANILRPKENYLTVVPGILGAYPNAFFHVTSNTAHAFISNMLSLQNEADYTKLAAQFGIRRTNPAFWSFSDELQAYYLKQQPIDAGVLDYNRLENR